MLCRAGTEEEQQQQQQLESLLAAAAKTLPVAQQGLATALDQTDGPALTLQTSTACQVGSSPCLDPALALALALIFASAIALAFALALAFTCAPALALQA